MVGTLETVERWEEPGPPDFGLQLIGIDGQISAASTYVFQSGDRVPLGVGEHDYEFISGESLLDGGGDSYVSVSGTPVSKSGAVPFEGWEEIPPGFGAVADSDSWEEIPPATPSRQTTESWES
jgi:hypothetical protein